MKTTANIIACDFCGKGQHEVKHLVAGPDPRKPAICDECVQICAEVLDQVNADEVANG